ncbi:MAG: DUF1015 domain-containing protein [Deltaproteobacteria bacterium]|nr:DUF1015 domain-containing protein [Deltaproteobacteria bacterium]
MIELRPFRALHYDASKVPLADVIAPPYDVIDDALLDRLYARNPHNVVRLILNKSPDRYAASAAELRDWRAQGVLVQDAAPALYWYAQDFQLADGTPHQRSGLLAAVRLQPFSNGNILPHERTFPSAKADRLKLMHACRANLSPIFGVYPGGRDAAAPALTAAETSAPWIDVSEGGQRHRVWQLTDAALVDRLVRGMGDTKLFIADGHHRYETALTYRGERHAAGDTDPDAPHNFLLMYLCAMDDPGLVVLPTHRLWRGSIGDRTLSELNQHFTIEDVDAASLWRRLEAATAPGVLGLRTRTRTVLLTLRDLAAVDRALPDVQPVIRHLDVTVLDSFLLGHTLGIDCVRAGQEGELLYTHDDKHALEAVTRGEAQGALLLRRPRMSEVADACLAGQTMPQKSTYFFPKLQTGLVFHLLDA